MNEPTQAEKELRANIAAIYRFGSPRPKRKYSLTIADYFHMGMTIIFAAVIIISFMITYDFMTSIFEGVNDPNPHASQPRHVNTTGEAKDILNQKAGTIQVNSFGSLKLYER